MNVKGHFDCAAFHNAMQSFTAANIYSDFIYEDQTEIFKYKLSNQPCSTFDSSCFMRAAKNAYLADAIWSSGECSAGKLNMSNDCR